MVATPDVATADLAVVGARIRTLDPDRPFAEAIAVREGVIVAVGDDDEIRRLCGATTTIVDGAGHAVVPGLTDAHIHPVWGSELAVGCDLNGLKTIEQVRHALARERERVGADGWVRGWGLDYAAFGDGPIHASALADAIGDAPAFLLFYDLHTALATPRALEQAGVSGPRTFGDASEIVCDDQGPTGELREASAYRLVLAAAPAPTAAEERARVLATLRRLNALGLTGGHVMDGSPETFALMRELEAAGELPMRLVVPLWQEPDVTDAQIEAQLGLRDERGRRWRGGVAKLFVDGVIDSGTAWLYAPDSEGGGNDSFWPDPARYAEVVARYANAGFQCVTHAVGDRAVAAALDAYRAAGRAANGAPHRIEHLETLTDGDLQRLAAEGVVASMQPLHMQWRQGDHSDSWATRLGPERSALGFRTRDLLDGGVAIALGSDWPVAQDDPRLGMAWARLRRTPGQPDAPVFEPDQVLTADEALAGYTTWAAAAVGEGDRQGRIAPGHVADLTALAVDPVEAGPDELIDAPILLTVVDGEIVHRAERP